MSVGGVLAPTVSSRSSARRPESAPEGPSRRTLLWPGLVIGFGIFISQFRTHTPVGAIFLYALVFAVGTTLPGVLLYRALRGRPPFLVADLALGSATGLIAQLPFWALAAGLRQPWLVWTGPVVIVAVFLAVPRLRAYWRMGRYPQTLPPYVAVAGLVAFALIMLTIHHQLFAAAPLPPGPTKWYVDLYFHTSVAADLTHHVLPSLPQVAGVPLSYHWFSHANQAAMSMSTGLALPLILVRLWAPLIAGVVVGLMMSLAYRITGALWPIAPAALLLAMNPSIKIWPWLFLPPGDGVILVNSPSMSYAVVFALLALHPVVDILRGRPLGRGWILLVAALLFCPGAKVSALPVLICGILLALVVTALHRRPIKRLLVLAAVAVAAQLALYPLVAGSGAGVRIRLFAIVHAVSAWYTYTKTPHDYTPGVLIPGFAVHGAAALMVVILIGYVLKFAWVLPAVALRRRAGDGGGGADRAGDTPPYDATAWLLLGCGIAGFAAMMLLDQDGTSQIYFMSGAVPLLELLAIWGLHRLWRRARPTWRGRHLAVVCVIAAVVVPLVLLGAGHLYGTRVRPEHYLVSAAITLGTLVVVTAAVVVAFRVVRRRPGWSDAQRATLPAVAAVAASVGLMVASVVPFVQQTVRPAKVGSVRGAAVVNTAEYRAADYIRRHSDADDVVATNVHCHTKLTTPLCNTSAFWVSAFTQRQSLLEGWAYSPAAHRLDGVGGRPANRQPYPDTELLTFNDGVFTHPTQAGVDRMWRLGVRWLYADRSAGDVNVKDNLSRYTDDVFNEARVSVYRLRPPVS